MSLWEDKIQPHWRKWLPVALLLALALTYRLCILFSLQGDPFIATAILDSAAYDKAGQEIANRSFWGDKVHYQDPLYPTSLGIFYKVFGRNLLAVKIVQALLATFGLWMLFEAARRIAGYGAAVGALALAALHQFAAFEDVLLLKEWMGPFFVEAALLCAVLGGWWWAGAGLSVGLAALVRGNLLVLAPLVLVWLMWKKEWRSAGLMAAGVFLAIAPVTIRNAVVGREFVLTTAQAGPNLYIGNNEGNWTGRYVPPPFVTASPDFEGPDFKREAEKRAGRPLTPGEAGAFWRRAAIDEILEHPGSFALATGRRTLMLLNATEVPDNFNMPFMRRYSWALWLPGLGWGIVLIPLAAAGIYLAWLDRKHLPHVGLLLLVLAGALVPLAFFFVFGRYRLPALPVLWIFAGFAIVKYAELRERGFVAVNRTALAIAVAVLVLAHLPVVRTDFRVPYYNLAIYHLERNEPRSAVQAVDSVFSADPELWKDLRFVAVAARAYDAAGEKGKALSAWQRCAEESGSHDAWAEVARNYGSLGEWTRAAEAYAKALPEYRVERAEVLVKLNDHWAAVESLKIAVQERPREARPAVVLARTYAGMGMWKEVVDWASKALEIDPGSNEAWRLREDALRKIK